MRAARSRFTWRQRLAARLAEAGSAFLFGFTTRILRNRARWVVRGPLDDVLEGEEPFLLAAWHQDVFPLFHFLAIRTHLERRRPLYMLASRSFDGEITERLCRPYGFRVARGSRGKTGARAATRELLAAVRDGCGVVIIADGPGPPPYRLKPGVVFLARETGAPLYGARAWCRPQLLLPTSWFRPVFPSPRSRIALFSDGPLDVSGSMEEARARVEGALANLNVQADRYLYGGPGSAGERRAAPDL